MDIHATPEGAFVVAWRKSTGEVDAPGTAVARAYKKDGTPATGSFFVSSLTDPKTDICFNQMDPDEMNIKVGMNNNIVCISWFSENGVATVDANDCSGQPKSQAFAAISTVARLFQVDVTNVDKWDLY
jgi:hypothetical protein